MKTLIIHKGDASKGESMTCIKCGKTGITPRFHDFEWGTHGCGYYNHNSKEHLHYYCICGYDWTGPLVNAGDETLAKDKE